MSATDGQSVTAAHGSQASYYDDSAALYADPKIRLHYPPQLYERVYAFAGPEVGVALDVACGTGQCARQLALRYKQAWHPQTCMPSGGAYILCACLRSVPVSSIWKSQLSISCHSIYQS